MTKLQMAEKYPPLSLYLDTCFYNLVTPTELASLIGVGRGVVSDYCAGKKRPHPDRLGWIAAICRLNPIELAEYVRYQTTAVEGVVTAYYRWLSGNLTNKELIDKTSRELTLAMKNRDRGEMEDALETTNECISLLQYRLLVEKTRKVQRELKELLLDALIFHMELLIAMTNRSQVVRAIGHDYQEAKGIAKYLRDPYQMSMVQAWLADAHYSARRLEETFELSSALIEQGKGSSYVYVAYRLHLLSSGHLGRKSDFLALEPKALEILEFGTAIQRPSDRASLYQAMATARWLLELDNAFERLQRGKAEPLGNNVGGRKALREVQLSVTELQMTLDKQEAISILKQLKSHPTKQLSNYSQIVNKRLTELEIQDFLDVNPDTITTDDDAND